MSGLKGRTIVITGASRGIGRAMALRFAVDGANIVVAAKTAEPHAYLPGTIHTVAEEVEKAGGKALPVQVDVRKEDQVQAMVEEAVRAFGGVDALVNNAGAISLTSVEATDLKRYDLIQNVNARAVFICSKAALAALRGGVNPHILNLSPPLALDRKWFARHAPYTVSKYGMTMLTYGMAEEFRRHRIAVNSLWPRTTIATAAIEFAVKDKEMLKVSRKPDIMADAAYEVLVSERLSVTGRALIDEDFLRERGVKDFHHYGMNPDQGGRLQKDLFVED